MSQARRARGAVAALFFVMGAMTGNLVPRFPDLKAQLELSNTAFGTAVGAYGLGALVLGLLGGELVRRFGSRRVAWVSTAAIAVNLVLIGLAPSWLALAAFLAVAGALDSYADIGANAHGLRLERIYGRSILNSLHGVWSIGAVVGGCMGAAAAGLGIAVDVHLAAAAALFGTVAVGASRLLLPGPDTVEPARPSGVHVRVANGIVALGLIAAMAQTMEDTTAAWGGLYLREELGAAAAVSGLGFIALQATQTVGRLLGDRVVTRHGDRAVARAGAGLAGCAMVAALAVPGHRDHRGGLRPRRAGDRHAHPRRHAGRGPAAPERHGPDAGGDGPAGRPVRRPAAGRRHRRRVEPARRAPRDAGGRRARRAPEPFAQRCSTVSLDSPPKYRTAMPAASSGSNALHEKTST